MEVTDTLGNVNYTFRIENHPLQDDKTFFNLVVNSTDDDNPKVYLIKYEMEEGFAGQFNSGEKELYDFEGYVTTSQMNFNDPCEETITPVQPNPGDGNPPGGGGPGTGSGVGYLGGGDPPLPGEYPDFSFSYDCDVTMERFWTCLERGNTYSFEICACISNPRHFKLANGELIVVMDILQELEDACNPNGEIGVFELKQEKECNKIKKVLNDNPEFKAQLIAESNGAATATNEKMITLRKKENNNSNNIIDDFVGVSGEVNVERNPSTEYIAMGHNHDGENTYSVYSLGDLSFVAGVDMVNGKIDMRNFVSFLYTAKGTRYAFTINNVTKFRAFFDFVKVRKEGISDSERATYWNKMDSKMKSIFNKYYYGEKDNPATPFIKENAPVSQNEIMLKHFINFLIEADAGISVFEVDATFETFTEITKASPTDLNRKNCN